MSTGERPSGVDADTGNGRHSAGRTSPPGPQRPLAGTVARRSPLPTLPDESVADELRATLDDLRRTLDDVSSAGVGPQRRRGRPGVWVAAAVVVLVLAGVFVLAVAGPGPFRRKDSAPTAGSTTSVPGRPTGSGSPSPSGSPSTAQGLVSPPLAPWPGTTTAAPRGLPETGPGIDAPGNAVVATVIGRDEQVYQRSVAAGALGSLSLAVPELTTMPGVARTLHPVVTDLTVAVNGRAAVVVAAPDGTWRILDTHPADVVELRFRLEGAVLDVQRATAGRVLVAVMPLTAGGPDGGLYAATQALVTGVPVQAAVCPDAPVSEQLCGTQTRSGLWLASAPGGRRTPLVLFSADVAAP